MSEEFDEAFDQEYDAIVLGTGLKECFISGLLSVNGKKVLQLERNDYYGGDCASMTPLSKLYEMFGKAEPSKDKFGSLREYNVDLIPKFIMGGGNLVKMLVQTTVTKYLQFKHVDGSYVYKSGKLYKVPVTPAEAISTSLMGFFEKRRYKNFLVWIQKWSPEDRSTWDGLDPKTTTMRQVFEYWGLDQNTQDFSGHAVALHRDDNYLDQKGYEDFVKRMQLYSRSLMSFKNSPSPYLYPLYGLGDIPQSLARLSAVYGGTFMLRRGVDEVLYDDQGQVYGVKSGDKVGRAKMVIGDPSYFQSKCKKVGKVVRCICILDHPIPGVAGGSGQIIIPQNQVGRNSDIYIMMMSNAHNVSAPGKYIAIISTNVETADPKGEIAVALQLIGKPLQRFITVSSLYEPTDDGVESRAFVSKSYDATSHFETTCEDIEDMWLRMTGEILDLSSQTSAIDQLEM